MVKFKASASPFEQLGYNISCDLHLLLLYIRLESI